MATKIAADNTQLKEKLTAAANNFSEEDYTALKASYAKVKGFLDANKAAFDAPADEDEKEEAKACKKRLREYFVGTACLRCSAKASDFIDSSTGEYLYAKQVCVDLVKDCSKMTRFNAVLGAAIRLLKRTGKLVKGEGDVPDDQKQLPDQTLDDLEDCASDVDACVGDNTKLEKICKLFNPVKPKDDLERPPADAEQAKSDADEAKTAGGSGRRALANDSEGDPKIDDTNGAKSVSGSVKNDGSLQAGKVIIFVLAIIVSIALF